MTSVVYRTDEFRRIDALPRRDPAAHATPQMVEAVTNALRLSCGTMRVLPMQAASLLEIAERGGLFGALGVGSGKTLLSFLAPSVVDAKRPVLLVPGGLVDKTNRDFAMLRGHWRETPMQVVSYQRLGRAGGSQILELYQPDMLVLDEVHQLRNREDAACARVVDAYLTAHPHVIVVALSGTITAGSLRDYAHIAKWALRDGTFLPTNWLDLDFWRRAVDAEVEAGTRLGPGCLLEWCTPEDRGTQLARARAAIARRMRETPGVIRTTETGCDASLYVSAIEIDSGVSDEAWSKLRTSPKDDADGWTLPNGDQMWDGLEVHRQARNFGNGYFSYFDPPPPKPWLDARKAWGQCSRWLIKNDRCNTEVEARTAAETEGEIVFTNPDGSKRVVDPVAVRDAWLAIRETFTPHTTTEWLADGTVRAVAAWARKARRGIVWTQHVAFGERLESELGLPYYRQKGYDRRGRYIEDAPEPVIVASVKANYTGRNLQKLWAKNLLVSPLGSAELLEQLIGRTHRQGQTADVVSVDVFVGCAEHVSALKRARLRAAAIAQLTDTPQKLCYCDWSIDLSAYAKRSESRWISRGPDESDETDGLDVAFTDEEE